MHWRVLGAADRELLEDYVLRLVTEKRWEAARGFTLTDEIQVTIAAQAALLVLGLGYEAYRGVGTIIVHPTTMQLTGERGGPIAGHAYRRAAPGARRGALRGPGDHRVGLGARRRAPSRARPQRRVPRVRAQARHARRHRRRHAAARARRGTDALDRGVHRRVRSAAERHRRRVPRRLRRASTRASSSPSSPKRSSTCPCESKPRSRTCTRVLRDFYRQDPAAGRTRTRPE